MAVRQVPSTPQNPVNGQLQRFRVMPTSNNHSETLSVACVKRIIAAFAVSAVLVVTGCSTSVSNSADPAPAGTPPPEVQIIDGHDAKPGQFPWMVSTQYAPLKATPLPLCGGSLIAPTWVLTGKHCHATWPTKNAKQWQVRVGSVTWNSDGQVVKVKRFVDYPDAAVDLALIELAAPITDITPIAYQSPDIADAYGVGANAIAMGWGTGGGSSILPSKTLKWVGVQTAPTSTCAGGTNGVFCAGFPDNKGSATCQFDSGGPYVWAKDGFSADGTPKSTPYVAGTLRGLNNESCGKPGKNDDWQATNPDPYRAWIAAATGS